MSLDTNPYEFLELVQEASYNTAMTSPVAGTNSIYVRLEKSNTFTMRVKPTHRKVGFGGGFDTPGYAVSDQKVTEGELTLTPCYSQAAFLMSWAMTRVNNAQTSPWTTTEPIGDLASMSVYHGTAYPTTGAVRRRLYGGVKVKSWSFGTNASTGLATLKLGLRASGPLADPSSGAFPAPADTVFPVDPILHYHISGNADWNSANLLYLDGISVEGTNVLDGKYFAASNGNLTFDRLRGMQAKIGLDVLYSASPEWRTLYEAITSQAATFTWGNGTHTVNLNMNGNVLVDSVDDDLSVGKVYMQRVGLEYQWDTSAGAPTFTFT